MSRVRRAGGTLFLHMDRAALCGRLPLAPPRGNPSRATPCCQRRLRQQSHALTPSLCLLALHVSRHSPPPTTIGLDRYSRAQNRHVFRPPHPPRGPAVGRGGVPAAACAAAPYAHFFDTPGWPTVASRRGRGSCALRGRALFCSCPAWVLRGAGRRGHLDEVFPCRGRDLRARAAAAPPHPPSPSRPSGPSRRRREAATTLAQGRVRWHRGVRHRPCPFFAPRA